VSQGVELRKDIAALGAGALPRMIDLGRNGRSGHNHLVIILLLKDGGCRSRTGLTIAGGVKITSLD
jgi:hypothetical protein